MAVSLALAGLAFMLTFIVGRPIVTYLRVKNIGKQVRIDGPEDAAQEDRHADHGRHHDRHRRHPDHGRLQSCSVGSRCCLPIGILLAAAILGAIDDRMNLVGGKQTRNDRPASRWRGCLLFGIVAGLSAPPATLGLGLHHVYVPFLGRFDIAWLYLPIAIFVIVGTANAVNFADGLDTLAAGLAAIAFVAYGVIAYRQGQIGVVTFCFTMVGSLLGFLWFNAHPAQVFMGDTGSLAIGSALAVAAFMTGQWLLLAGRRRRLRGRGRLGHPPGRLFQTDRRQAHLQDDAAPPSLRA